MFWRVAIAFFVAPAVVSLGVVLTTWPSSDPFQDHATWYLFLALIYYVYPLGFTVVLALPLYLYLKALGLVNRWVCLGAGMFFGAMGAVVEGAPGLWFSSRLVILGGMAGLVFWYIERVYQPPKWTL